MNDSNNLVNKLNRIIKPVSAMLTGGFFLFTLNFASLANATPNSAAAQILQKMNQIQQEIQVLRAEVENQKFILNQSLAKEKDRYVDIDQRLQAQAEKIKKLEQLLMAIGADGDLIEEITKATPDTSSAKPAPKKPGQTSDSNPKLTDAQAYNIASKLRSQRKFDEAEIEFKNFIKNYPNSRLTSNSYYWLGEIYMLRNKTEEAEKMFSVVANKYGNSNKALDAWYKLGLVQARYGNTERAKRSMQTLKRKHPNTPAGELAATWLKRNK